MLNNSIQRLLNHHPHAHAHDWVRNPLKRSEITPLLAILLTMGVLGFPTLRLGSLKYNVSQHKINNYTITMFRSYWSTKWPFSNTIFSNIMSGRRFELLMSYLHLNDTSQMPDQSDPNHDKLYAYDLSWTELSVLLVKHTHHQGI